MQTGRTGDAAGRAVAGIREAARRKGEIIDAAASVFARMGFHGASTRDIADRVSMRQASVYYYFRSKEAALEEVCTAAMGDVLERAQRILAQRRSASVRVVALVRHHLVRMNQRPDYARVFLTQRRFLTGAARERVRRVCDDYERIIVAAIADGVARGEFRRDPSAPDMAMAVLGLCNAALLWHGTVPGMTDDRAVRIVAPLLVDGLRAGAGADVDGAHPATRPVIPGHLFAIGDSR